MHCILVMRDVFCLCYFFASTMLFKTGWALTKHVLHLLLICLLPKELNLETPPSTPSLCNLS